MTKRTIIFINLIIGTYCLIALYTIAPILCVLISSAVASATGSRLDEGDPHPTYVLGVDVGGILNKMFVCGWLIFVTVPTGLLAMLLFTISLFILAIIWAIRRHREKPHDT